MAADLMECLASLPSLVSRLDRGRASGDLNEIEIVASRTDEYLELLLLLSGSYAPSIISNFVSIISHDSAARLEDNCRNSVMSPDLRLDCERTIEDLTSLVAVLYEYLQIYTDRSMELEDSLVSHENASIPVTVMRSGASGRPFLFISKDQIETLLEFGYTYTKIASMFWDIRAYSSLKTY